MGAVYRLTLRQLSGRWRLAIMAVLAALPVVIVLLMLRSDDAPSVREFEAAILGAMLAGSAGNVPSQYGGASTSVSAIADEIRARAARARRPSRRTR